MTDPSPPQNYVHVPVTASLEARQTLAALLDPALKPDFPDAADIEGWRKLQAWAEADGKGKSEPLLNRGASHQM